MIHYEIEEGDVYVYLGARNEKGMRKRNSVCMREKQTGGQTATK